MSPRRSETSKMTSILRKVAGSLTPNGSNSHLSSTIQRHDGFHTAKTTDALFPRTREEVDGEECLHDCESCTIRLPRGFKIDEEDELFGGIKGWSRHLVVATGKTDWVRDVADEKGSVMEAIDQHNEGVKGGRLMLSASNIPLPDGCGTGDVCEGPYGEDRETRVLLLPAFQMIEGVTPRKTPELIRCVINAAPTNTQGVKSLPYTNGSLSDATTENCSNHVLPSMSLPTGLTAKPCPHKHLILLCSQATRDARCGQSAPLLRRELERHLRPLGLYRDLGDERPGGVGIYFISHVGGHKYSANMIVYRRADPARSVTEQMANGAGGDGLIGGKPKAIVEGEAAQCIWLARVRPEDCENIVRFTVLQGKVVKPERQLRGGFDRAKGLVSW